MNKTIELDEKMAREIYPTANAEVKSFLENNWGVEFFLQKSLKERVTTWEACAAEYGIDPVSCLPYPDPKDSDEVSHNAYFQLTKLFRLFKNGKAVSVAECKKMNYKDKSYKKHFNYFEPEGDGFRFDGVADDAWGLGVGSRLSVFDSEDAKHVAITFPEIWNNFFKE